MKKIIVAITALMLMAVAAIAAPEPTTTYDPYAKNNGPAGNSGVGHLYMVEKDPMTWDIVEDGAWAKMTYNTRNNKYVANAHMLEPETEYALVHYHVPDSWPFGHVLARSTTDADGNVQFKGEWTVWNDKFWVVKSDDIMGTAGDLVFDTFMAWNPSEYLFEYDVV